MLSLPSMVSSATDSHVLESIKKNLHVNHNHRSMSHPVEKNSNRSNTSYLSLTFLVSFSMLSLPPMVSSTTSSHVLNVIKHVETFMSTNVSKAYHILVEENSNRSDLSYLSATSLVFSSMLFLLPTVSSTTSSHVLNVVGQVEG